MSEASVERVREIMAREWRVASAEIPDDAALGRYPRWDSLGHISLLLALQREIGLPLSPDSVQRLNSLPRIVEHLASAATAAHEKGTACPTS